MFLVRPVLGVYATQHKVEENHDPALYENFSVWAFLSPLDDFGHHPTYKKKCQNAYVLTLTPHVLLVSVSRT